MMALFAQHVIITAGLAVAVAVSCLLLRSRPAVCHALWLVVLMRLIVPPVVTWPWTPAQVIDGLQALSSSRAETPGAERPEGAAATISSRLLRLIGSEDPEPAESASDARAKESGLWGRILPALFASWALGSVLMTGLQIVRFLRFRRLSNAAHSAPARLDEQSREIARRFALDPPAVVTSDAIASAAAWGGRKATVLIPTRLLDEMDDDRCRVVLAHELAHLKRRDHWTGWIELVAGCIWWWNPVFWYARKRLHEAAEMACDAWVIWALPERRREYAETLVRAAELASQSRGPAPVLGMGGGPSVAFERRLLMILRQQVACRIPVPALGLILMLAVAVSPGWSQVSPPHPIPEQTAAAPAPPDVQKLLDSPVAVKFEHIHLLEIVEFINDSWDINIAIDWRAVARPPKPKPATPASEGNPHPREALRKPGPDCVTDGIVPYINVQNVTVREFLSALLRPLNLTFTVEPHHIWISSPALIELDAGRPKPSLSSASENLAKTLQDLCGIEFENIHIQDIIDFISDSWKVNIILDSRVVRPPKTTESRTPAASTGSIEDDTRWMGPPLSASSSGYTTDGVVPGIDLRNVPLAECLEVVLRPLNLTFKADKDLIWISSPFLIDTPYLTSENVRKPDPLHPYPVTVAMILETRDGLSLAWINQEGRMVWCKEGDTCRRGKLVRIDPKEGVVKLNQEIGNELGRNETQLKMPVIKEPEPSGPVNEQLAPHVRAVRIRTANDDMRIQIRTAAATKWFREGDRFEDYEVLRIDPNANTVLLSCESKKTPFILTVRETE